MTSDESGMSANTNKRNWVTSPWKLAAVSLLFLLLLDVAAAAGLTPLINIFNALTGLQFAQYKLIDALLRAAACAPFFILVCRKQMVYGIVPAGKWRVSLVALAGIIMCAVAVISFYCTLGFPLHSLKMFSDPEFLYVFLNTYLYSVLEVVNLFSQFLLLCLPLALLKDKPGYVWKVLLLILSFSAVSLINAASSQFFWTLYNPGNENNTFSIHDYAEMAVRVSLNGLFYLPMLLLARRVALGKLFDTAALFLPVGIAINIYAMPALFIRLFSGDWADDFSLPMELGAAAFLAAYAGALGLVVFIRRRKTKKPIETGSP